jgi:hypothetical protein
MASNGEFTLEQLENMLAGTGGDMFDAQWQVQQRYNQQLAQQQLQNQLLEQRQAMLSRQHYLLQVCLIPPMLLRRGFVGDVPFGHPTAPAATRMDSSSGFSFFLKKKIRDQSWRSRRYSNRRAMHRSTNPLRTSIPGWRASTAWACSPNCRCVVLPPSLSPVHLAFSPPTIGNAHRRYS